MNETTPRASLITRPFVAVTLATFAFFTYVGILVPLVPQYVENELGLGELGIGLNIAAFALASILARGFLGHLIDRYGRRALMIGGALIAAGAGVVTGQVEALALLLMLRGITGIGEAALFVAATTLVADLSPNGRRAEAASYFSVAVFGGIGIGPVVSETLLADDRFQLVFLIGGAFAVLAALLSIGVPSRVVSVEAPPRAAPRQQWVHPAALGPGLVLGAGVAAFAAYGAFLPDYSREVGLANSGALFAAYSAVVLVLRIAGARLPEQLGARLSVTIALSSVGVGLVVLAVFATTWSLWVSSLIFGLGNAFLYPSLMAATVDRVSEHERARALSSFTMFFEVGTAVGGLALGALAEVTGKRWSFLAGVVPVVFGLWVLRTRVAPADPAHPQVTGEHALIPVAGE
jgi:MFS family permease